MSVELLALISVVTGSPAHAALLLGGADRVRHSVGLSLFGSANLAASHDHCVALCLQAAVAQCRTVASVGTPGLPPPGTMGAWTATERSRT